MSQSKVTEGTDKVNKPLVFVPQIVKPEEWALGGTYHPAAKPKPKPRPKPKPSPNAESWSLVEELSQNRNAYKVPDDGIPLKLNVPYQEQVRRLCKRVGLGHNGKDPGFQPAGFAMIKYSLPVIEEWKETKELTESVSRRIDLPDDADKEISREICRYAGGLRLLSAPPATTGTHNVVLDKATGSRLKISANKMDIPYHALASLCVLVALSVQSVGVNLEEKKEISELVEKIRRQMNTAGWCAGALMDKLYAERARA